MRGTREENQRIRANDCSKGFENTSGLKNLFFFFFLISISKRKWNNNITKKKVKEAVLKSMKVKDEEVQNYKQFAEKSESLLFIYLM